MSIVIPAICKSSNSLSVRKILRAQHATPQKDRKPIVNVHEHQENTDRKRPNDKTRKQAYNVLPLLIIARPVTVDAGNCKSELSCSPTDMDKKTLSFRQRARKSSWNTHLLAS